jgi:hypothetical protein
MPHPQRMLSSVNRNEPSERIWNALKRLAESEAANLTHTQAIKRVKAVVKKEGAFDLPERALQFYAQEYCEMVSRNRVKPS